MTIEVYNMNPNYKELDGIYETKQQIFNKISKLTMLDKFEETKCINIDNCLLKIGKCRNCQSYGKIDKNNNLLRVTLIYSNYCENDKCTNRQLYSKWSNIHLDDNGKIYTKGSDTIIVYKTIGYYRFINNN